MARSRSRSRSRSRTQSKSRSRTQSRSRSRSRSRSKSRSRSHSRSRSRSPRWKHRSFSPAFRSQEQFKGKPFQDNHRGEFRGFRRGMRRPMQRRVEDWKRNQTNSRFPPHENVHHRNFEPRPPSPNFRRSPSFENLNRPFRNFSPPRGVGNRRYPRLPPVSHPPRYTEQGAYKDNEWNFHEQKTRGRYLDDKPRPFRGGRGWRPFRRPFSGPFQRDERWHENDNFRHRKSPSDEYLQPHRRSPEGFVPRDSFHKRFPEEREFKDRGPIPKRAREVERHEARDPPRRPRWTPDRSPPFHRRGAGRFGPRARLSMERARSDGPAASKVPFNYSQKPQRYPDGKQSFDGQAHKFTRLEEQKANAPTFLSRDKEVDNYNDKRVKPTEGGPPKINKKHPKDDGDAKPVSAKVKERGWKEDGDARCIPNKPLEKAKKDQSSVKPVPGKSKERVKKEPCDLRFVAGKLRDRVKKEADTENDPDSTTSAHEKNQPPSELKAPGIDSPRTKSFTVQVDMKKRVDKYRLSSGSAAERQLSQDLVAASRKEDHFHPVFEHIDSATPSGQNSPKSEFIQEVITITHQVKANYFKSSELTLHERFSKLKDKKVDDKKEATERQDPEIHRRIDISLADLQNKRSNKSASEQIRSSSGVLSKVKTNMNVIEDPNDLRHNLERKRRKRLLSEDDCESLSPENLTK